MVKKIKMAAIYIGVLFMLSACSSPEGYDSEEIANNGVRTIQLPEGCEIVEDINEFEGVTQDQSYNKETDASTVFDVYFGGTDTGDVLYLNVKSNWLAYFDKNTGNSGLVCGKPDCDHNNASCNAIISDRNGVQYYDGDLYTVKKGGNGFVLEKIAVDGTEREEMGNLLGVKTAVASPMGGDGIEWIIHRGYIYYWYFWETSHMDEEYYYLNNSHCIYRKSLEKDGEPECIIAMPVLSHSVQLIGSGSYVYMTIATEDQTEGYLYRYNIENGKLEWFKEWGNEIAGAAIHEGKIYYLDKNISEQKTEVYCYDIETNEKSLVFEIEGVATEVRYDEDYMYIGHYYKNETEIGKIDMWSWQGEYIADVPFYNEFNEEGRLRIIGGSDKENIYVWCMVSNPDEENIYNVMGSYTTIEYIEKKDILDDGEYEIKEWSEMVK